MVGARIPFVRLLVASTHGIMLQKKAAERLGQQREIMGLRDKKGLEAKAKRLGAQKAADHEIGVSPSLRLSTAHLAISTDGDGYAHSRGDPQCQIPTVSPSSPSHISIV